MQAQMIEGIIERGAARDNGGAGTFINLLGHGRLGLSLSVGVAKELLEPLPSGQTGEQRAFDAGAAETIAREQ